MLNDKDITWLQLSDLHIFESVDWTLMIDSYKKLAERIHPDFIVITGDYRHMNHDYNHDYSKTLQFLEEMIHIFKVKNEDVFLLPGNHDVDDYEFRKESIAGIVGDPQNPEKYKEYLEKSVNNLKTGFKAYSEFVKKFYAHDVSDERISNSDGVIHLTWKNKINIIILNTALISDGNRDHGEIIDIISLSEVDINNGLSTLVLGHHDFNSICESQRACIARIFEKLDVKAYLCGDTHKENIKFIDKYDAIDKRIPCIICGKSAVQSMDEYSDVGVISYNWKEDGFVYVTPYRWSEKYSFKKSDKFIYDIDKDYRFAMSEETNKTDDMVPCVASKAYANIMEAHYDIANDIKNGGFFKFYGLRGATFIGEPEINVIINELKSNPDLQIKFLISYPFSEEVRHRLKNIPEFASEDQCEGKWRDTYKKVILRFPEK